MANPNPTKKIQKGEVLNPNGRPKDPVELHLLKQLTRSELRLLINRVLQAKPEELDNFRGSVVEIWLASSVSRAIKAGNMVPLTELLEKLLPGGLEDPEADEYRELLATPYDEIMADVYPKAIAWKEQQLLKKGKDNE